MKNDDDQKWQIPEKYRASLDMTDEAAYELLKKCDEQQAEWATTFNSPFAGGSPLERARAKAVIEIEHLQAVAADQALTADQCEVLAECYATIGRYDLAAEVSRTNSETYEKYWAAVFLPDDEWCEHVAKHKFVKQTIYSIKHNAEMPLLACNIPGCDTWNVLDLPEEIAAARAKRAEIREAAKGQNFASIQDALRWHQQRR